jgi:hypothetical protein
VKKGRAIKKPNIKEGKGNKNETKNSEKGQIKRKKLT